MNAAEQSAADDSEFTAWESRVGEAIADELVTPLETEAALRNLSDHGSPVEGQVEPEAGTQAAVVTSEGQQSKDVLQDLIDELGRLPGVGPKSAQRIAFHILQAEPTDVRRLAHALLEVKDKVRFCAVCGNVAQEERCNICRDPRRDTTVICVVEEPKDVVAIERTREFRGKYHVLGGAISPIEGVGPDDLRIRELLARLADGEVTELILATDPNLEGEATAAYLARMIKPMGLKVTRLASELPGGGDLEYADEITLGRAFEGRRLLSGLGEVNSQ